MVTRDGIPIRCWIWPSNTADVSIVPEVKKDLIGWKLGRVISVADRGFSSEANLRILQQSGGHYIIGEKSRLASQRSKRRLPIQEGNSRFSIKIFEPCLMRQIVNFST